MCDAYATDANTRLLTAILGDSLQTSSAQRRREFGTLVMDMFVDGNSYVRKPKVCSPMRFRGQRLLLFEYCTPSSTFSVHKQQFSEPARHRRAAVLIATQAHLFLSVI
jgi:hypothetical protein